MKNAFLIILSVIFLLMLSSCVTAGAVIRSNFEGLPVWYYIPQSQVKNGRTVFIGEGKAPSQRQAKLLAYSNLAENIGNYFGEGLNDEYYRELTVYQTIADFDLTVSDSDTFTEGGVYKVLLRATADTDLIEKSRSDSALEKQKKSEEIKELVSEGVELMKEGLDFLATEKYLDAMLLAYDVQDIDSYYSFEALLNECLLIINSVSFEITEAKPSEASCRLMASVTEGKLTSPAVSCPVVASFLASGVDGKVYNDYFYCRTSELGDVGFFPSNNAILKKGSIVFSLDYEDQISKLENKAGKEKISALRDAFERKKTVFDYNLVYTNKTVGLAVMDFDLNGEKMNPSLSLDYYQNKFSDSGIMTKVFDCNSQIDDSEILENYRTSGNQNGYLFISRISEIDSFESETGIFIVSCEGSFSVYDTNSLILLESSEIVFSTGFGKTQVDAKQKSFENLADLFFSFLRSVYV